MSEIQLPNNIEAEEDILGIILESFDVDKCAEIVCKLASSAFFKKDNRDLFSFLQKKILLERECVSFATIPYEISHLLGRALAYQSGSLINELNKLDLQREIIIKAAELQQKAYALETKSELLAEINAVATDISGRFTTANRSEKSVVQRAIERVKDALSGESESRVLYHHDVMDSCMSIFRKQMNAIGAFQGTGKTALALETFKGQLFAGMRVAYFCTESSSDELLLRIASGMAGLAVEDCLNGNITETQLPLLKSAFRDLKAQEDHFYIIGLGEFDCRLSTVDAMASRIAREDGPIDAIYIDFLQDFKPPFELKLADDRETISHNTKAFKDLIVKLNCAGNMLCQFNQETHRDKMPTKKSFRGSGVIVDQSHIMTVLYDPSKVSPEDSDRPSDPVDLLIYSVKTRLISKFMRKVMFFGRTGSFRFPTRYSGDDIPDYEKQYK